MTDRPLVHYWLVLYRRRGLVFVTLLSSMLLAWLLSVTLPKVYEARAVMFVPATDSRVSFTSEANNGGLSQTPLFPAPDDQVAAMHIGILQSKEVARRVAQEFPAKGLDDLKKDVDFVMNSYYMLEIYARDRDPARAAAIANAYPRHFNDLQRSFSLARFEDTKRTLDAQIESTSRSLASIRRQREDFQKKNRLVSMQEETEALGRQRVELQGDLDNAEVSLRAAEEKIRMTQAQLAEEAKVYVPGESVTTNALIEQLRNKITDLEIRMAGQKTELTQDHPEVASLRAQYEEARKAMEAEIGRVVGSQTKLPGSVFETLRLSLATAHLDREVMQARVSGLRQALERLDRTIADVPGRQRELEDLDLVIRQQESALEILRRKQDEVGSQARWEYQSAVVVEHALAPETPAFPVLWLNLAVGGALGLLGGILYAFFVEYVREAQRELQFGAALEAARQAGD